MAQFSPTFLLRLACLHTSCRTLVSGLSSMFPGHGHYMVLVELNFRTSARSSQWEFINNRNVLLTVLVLLVLLIPSCQLGSGQMSALGWKEAGACLLHSTQAVCFLVFSGLALESTDCAVLLGFLT